MNDHAVKIDLEKVAGRATKLGLAVNGGLGMNGGRVKVVVQEMKQGHAKDMGHKTVMGRAKVDHHLMKCIVVLTMTDAVADRWAMGLHHEWTCLGSCR